LFIATRDMKGLLLNRGHQGSPVRFAMDRGRISTQTLEIRTTST
jgi:hypothetical protein